MSTQSPKVSIGLPVYNGDNYLASALDSILAQTFTDFEVVISDNASTDGTEAICREYAAKDGRIRYHRSPTNRGASWNYNTTFELARGDYFRWAAHDDLMDPALLEKSVAVLDEHPEIVLCFTWVIDIDENDQEIELKKSGLGSDLPLPHQRFRGLSTVRPAFNCEEIFGMVRSEHLAKTKLIAPYSDSDRTLLAQLGLIGPFYEIPEPLFLHRIHAKGSVVVNPKRQERTAWFDTSKAGKIVLPSWRQLRELLEVIWKSPVSWSERLRCYAHMFTWIKRRRIQLRRDVVWAIRQLV